jgi:hypothetical protein
MTKTRSSKFYTCLLLAVFVITSVQCARSIAYNTSLAVFTKTSKSFSEVQHAFSSGTSSKITVFLAIEEEFEENEDIIEKYHLPVLTYADLFSTLYFKEIHNHFFISQPSNGSVSSIPLHVKNCVYLI